MPVFPFLIVEVRKGAKPLNCNGFGFQFKEKTVMLNKSNNSWELRSSSKDNNFEQQQQQQQQKKQNTTSSDVYL